VTARSQPIDLALDFVRVLGVSGTTGRQSRLEAT
jgi:hypothetical protein